MASIYPAILVLVLVLASPTAHAFGRHAPELPPVEDHWDQYYPRHPAPAPSPVVGHGSVTLRVLNYNVHGLPLPGIDRSRFRDIGKILGDRRRAGTAPHVVALQEAFDDATKQLIDAAGYPYVSKGPQGADARYNSGLVILSEFPIAAQGAHVFEDCRSWDCLTRKGIQHARLSVPGLPRPLDFFNTHLNSDPDTDFWTPVEETEEARLLQIQEIRDFYFEKNTGGSPLLSVGDFNFHPNEYAYESLVSFASVTDAARDCGLRGPTACVATDDPTDDWRRTLDRQFYRDGGGPSIRFTGRRFAKIFKDKVNGRELSDHQGLEIEYQLSW